MRRSDYWANCLLGAAAKLRGDKTFPVWHGRRIKHPDGVKTRGVGGKKLGLKHRQAY
jgi:hypothetical protein